MEQAYTGPTISAACKDDPEGDGCSAERLPPGFQTENEKVFVGRMNGTTYCRDKVSEESKLQWDVVNICNHGPFAFRVLDFLSDAEMAHIKEVGQAIGLKRSTVSEEALETVDR